MWFCVASLYFLIFSRKSEIHYTLQAQYFGDHHHFVWHGQRFVKNGRLWNAIFPGKYNFSDTLYFIPHSLYLTPHTPHKPLPSTLHIVHSTFYTIYSTVYFTFWTYIDEKIRIKFIQKTTKIVFPSLIFEYFAMNPKYIYVLH